VDIFKVPIAFVLANNLWYPQNKVCMGPIVNLLWPAVPRPASNLTSLYKSHVTHESNKTFP